MFFFKIDENIPLAQTDERTDEVNSADFTLRQNPTQSAEPGTADAGPPADGMMAGVVPGAKPSDDDKKKMLPVSTFGRYVKILMSSNEFLFVS